MNTNRKIDLPNYQKIQNNNPLLNQSKPYPLKGLLVIDFSRVLAGPYCAKMLADAGARVIHIERPNTGDDTRLMEPYTKDNVSEYYRLANVGKESIALNLKDVNDRNLAEKMIAKADIVIENSRPGVMKRLHLDSKEMTSKYPKLIYASISGFGQTGELATNAAYDTTIQALSGMMDATGTSNGLPTRVGTPITDMVAGMMAYAGITTALYARERTGKGTAIDISMLDVMVNLLIEPLVPLLGLGQKSQRTGNRLPYMYPFDTFMCKDKMIAICAGNDHLWQLLCKALNHFEWIDQSKFKTNILRDQNWQQVKQAMENVLKTHSAIYWHQQLSKVGVPNSIVQNVADTIQMKQVADRGIIKTLADDQNVLGTPLNFSTWNSYGATADAPALNEDGKKIRKEFE